MYRIRRFGIIKTATMVAALYMVAIAIFAIPLAWFISAVGSAIPSGAGPSIDASGSSPSCCSWSSATAS